MRRFLKLLPVIAAAVTFYVSMPANHGSELYASMSGVPIPETVYLPPTDQLTTNEGSSSASNTKTVDENGKRQTCKSLPEAQGVLLGLIVPCIIHTIENSTITFTQKMIDWLEPTMYAFMTLVVVLFGVKALQGEQKVHVQAFMLVVKIAFVLMMLNWIPHRGAGTADDPHGGIESVYGMMTQGVETAASALGSDPDGIGCDIDKYGDANTPLIWKQSDCVLGKLYGFTVGKDTITGKKTTNMLLASSAFGLLSGFVFGGTLGVAVFFALVGVLVSIAMLIIRVAMSFLNGYLIVCVMLIIAPLFMPLVFLKVTSDYFEKWWKAILGGMLLPVIVTCYTVVALLAYDAILFKPDSKMQNLFNNDMIKTATEQSSKACDMAVANNPDFQLREYQKKINKEAAYVNPTTNPVQNNAVMKFMMDNPSIHSVLNPLLNATNDACGPLNLTKFDPTKIGADPYTQKKNAKYLDKKGVMLDLFMQAIEIFIMCYLISTGLKEVESTFSSFSAGSSLGSTLLRAQGITTAIGGAFQNFQNKMRDQVRYEFDANGNVTKDYGTGGRTGAAFIKNLPKATSKATTSTLGGFLGGINRQ